MKFSERYGYVKPAEVLKGGPLDKECLTALCNCYDHLDPQYDEAKWMLVVCRAFINSRIDVMPIDELFVKYPLFQMNNIQY